MAKQDLPGFKYIIVHDDGKGKDEFIELFGQNWGVIKDYATGNAVHFLMRKEPPAPAKPVIETMDAAANPPLIPEGMFPRRRRG